MIDWPGMWTAFISMFIMDVFFALYVQYCAAGEKFKASVGASLIAICNAGVILSLVSSATSLVGAVLGAFIGDICSHVA